MKKLCDEIRISTAYLSDTENGNRFPSKEKLDEFIKAFNLKDDEEDRFYDLVSREIPNKYKVSEYIAEYIMKKAFLRNFIRIAKDKKLDNLYCKSKIKELESESE